MDPPPHSMTIYLFYLFIYYNLWHTKTEAKGWNAKGSKTPYCSRTPMVKKLVLIFSAFGLTSKFTNNNQSIVTFTDFKMLLNYTSFMPAIFVTFI